jgi:hypothetical protein
VLGPSNPLGQIASRMLATLATKGHSERGSTCGLAPASEVSECVAALCAVSGIQPVTMHARGKIRHKVYHTAHHSTHSSYVVNTSEGHAFLHTFLVDDLGRLFAVAIIISSCDDELPFIDCVPPLFDTAFSHFSYVNSSIPSNPDLFLIHSDQILCRCVTFPMPPNKWILINYIEDFEHH